MGNAEPIMIDTPEGIERYYLLARYHALKLEVKFPGMTYSRGSVMKFLKEKHGFKGNTKKAVLAEYGQYLMDEHGMEVHQL